MADAANDPRRIAVDLLAQAEHDEAAQSILITDDAAFADAVAAAVTGGTAHPAPRGDRRRELGAMAPLSWCDDWDEAAALVDRLAPEHLQLMLRDPEPLFARVRHAGGDVPRRVTAPRRLGTTSPARTMCCRPGAPRGLPPGCRCSTS